MSESFSKIAPYLSDPFILVGFFIFAALLLTRMLLKSGMIPPVAKNTGGQIIKLVLHYGFVFGLVLLCLAFLYKYRVQELTHMTVDESKNQVTYRDISKQISVAAKEFITSYPAKNPIDGTLVTVKVHIRYPQIAGHPEKKLKERLTTF